MRRRWPVVVAAVLAGAWLAAVDAIWSLTTNSFDLHRYRWLLLGVAGAGSLLAGMVAGVRAVLRRPRGRIWIDGPPADRVARPELEERLARRLIAEEGGLVAASTGLFGAGGFGKTTLANQVCWNRRVRRMFKAAVWVTVGEEPTEAYLLGAVNDLYRRLAGQSLNAENLEQAGHELGRLLDTGPRVLLVIDDVWRPEDLRPFLQTGRRCTRLVTTRRPGLLPPAVRDRSVKVNEFTLTEAQAVLAIGLPGMDPALMGTLLDLTGQWPLLVRMSNRHLFDEVGGGSSVDDAARRLIERLVDEGPTTLRLDDEASRNQAAAASIGASLSRLTEHERTKYIQLGIFAEDLAVPADVLAMLWSENPNGMRRLCERLDGLSLLDRFDRAAGMVQLHDVVRSFLRHQYPQAIIDANVGLVMAARQLVASADDSNVPTPWWRLPDDSYFWSHLCQHLDDGKLVVELTSLLADLRWAEAKLSRPQLGPLSLDSDYKAGHGTQVAVLRRAIRQAAHLLGPIQPEHSLPDVIISRLDGDTRIASVVNAYRSALSRATRITNRWPPPDRADPALSYVLTGHEDWVQAVAAAPDGSWLVTASRDGTARIWDAATGALRHKLTGHRGPVVAVEVASDGSWLVTASWDGTARVWDTASGALRHTLAGHGGPAVAVAPDGSWLVTVGDEGTALLWDAATGVARHQLIGHSGAVTAVAVAPDGSWLVTACVDGTAQVWDAASGGLRNQLGGYAVVTGSQVVAVKVAPNGSWLVTISENGTTRVWDAVSGSLRHELIGPMGRTVRHTVPVIGIAPDGSWLVTASSYGLARVWDAATGVLRHELTGHTDRVTAVGVGPDGDWLVTTSSDMTARLWDVASGALRHKLTGHSGAVTAVAVASDGSWLVTTSSDTTARLWDTAGTSLRRRLIGHVGPVVAMAVAPDGSWLVTTSDDETTRVWDAASGRQRYELTGHTNRAVAVAPGGSWLATVSEDGGLTLRDAGSGTLLWHGLSGHGGPVAAVVIAPDGSWVATASRDGTARLWRTDAGPLRHGGLFRHGDPVVAIAVAPDGSWLATVCEDGAARIWNPLTGVLRHKLTGHAGPVTAVAVAPDSSWLVTTGRDRAVMVWDAASGVLRHNLTGHTSRVAAVAVAPDGSWLVTASENGAVMVWDAASGVLRHKLAAHIGRVAAVAVAPDGSWLVTAGSDGTARVWDAVDGESRATIRTDTPLELCSVSVDAGIFLAGRNHVFGFTVVKPGAQPNKQPSLPRQAIHHTDHLEQD